MEGRNFSFVKWPDSNNLSVSPRVLGERERADTLNSLHGTETANPGKEQIPGAALHSCLDRRGSEGLSAGQSVHCSRTAGVTQPQLQRGSKHSPSLAPG